MASTDETPSISRAASLVAQGDEIGGPPFLRSHHRPHRAHEGGELLHFEIVRLGHGDAARRKAVVVCAPPK
jgi:hypothetical protein